DVTAISMLNVDDVSVTRSRFVGIRGGNGGAGDDGNNGQIGFPGSDAPLGSGLNGQQGQDGGDGFDGGNGGNGGDVVIVGLSSVDDAQISQNIVDRPAAGIGGRGGNGGNGGRGGRGGDGGSNPINDGGDGARGGRGGDGGRGGIGGSSGEMSVVQYVAFGFQQTGSTVVAHNTVYQMSSGQGGMAGAPGPRGIGGQGGDGGDGGIFGNDGSNGFPGNNGNDGQPGFAGFVTPSAAVRLDDVTFGGPGSGDARIHNNIFSPSPVSSLLGTTIAIDGTPAFTCDARSNVFSGFDQLASGISPVGIGSVLTQPPLFENANASDFRPQIGSFLVDGGDNSVTPAGIEEDFFGNPRFMDEPSTPTTGPGGQFAVDFGAIERLGDTFGSDCLADVNGDGTVTPSDFTAWVIAFNTQAPGCDQNGDGLCTPSDFTAWVLNFNAGCQ
ncbi:MAG: GC-type dockerin domain-anchored protein, partial [Planctomycetota bacterium]